MAKRAASIRTSMLALLLLVVGPSLVSSSAGSAGAAGASVLSDARREAGVSRRDVETLIFDEEFEDFNFDLWKHEITMGGGGNWEFQVYGNNRTNSYVEDGKLIIQPTLTADYLGAEQVSGMLPTTFDIWGLVPADQCTSNMFYGCSRGSNLAAREAINPVMSARVRTAGTFSFRYGRFEAKAKLPKGDWLWPAIWLLPENNVYGQWPASGEIDIMESRGNAPSYAADMDDVGGVDTSSSAIHWGPHFNMDSWDMTYGTLKLDEETFNDDFHVFGLYWDDKQMYTYLDTDDNRLLTVDFGDGTDEEGFWEKGQFAARYPGMRNPWKGRGVAAPYDQRFYIVMNVAVGGVSGFFPDHVGGKMWTNNDNDAAMKFHEATPEWFSTWDGTTSAMQVESVKVWQSKPDYFLDAAAGAGIASTAAATDTEAELANDRDFGSPSGSSSGSTSAILLNVGCALLGGLIGAVGVGLVMLRQSSIKLSQIYDSINNSGPCTPGYGTATRAYE